MIRFLLKGLLRDSSRSLFPVIIIALGAFLTCLMEGYLTGAYSSMLDKNAKFLTGHVKVMSKGYEEISHQSPNDLALLEVDTLINTLKNDFPTVHWAKRIKFSGLLDIPNEERETRAQGPVTGMAIDLFDFSAESDIKRLALNTSLRSGRLPTKQNEMLLGEYMFNQFQLGLGDEVTLLTTSADGVSVASNFFVVGTLSFGIQSLDRLMMIADLKHMQYLLNMDNSVGEILGFLKNNSFDDDQTVQMEQFFKEKSPAKDDFSPVLRSLRHQNMLADMIDLGNKVTSIVIVVFILLVTIVIWNTRLIANLRRYGEIGLRLAIGESKKKLIYSMLIEAILLGVMGGVLGTFFGCIAVYFLERYGINIAYATQGQTSMVISDVIRGKLSLTTCYIGFVPALVAPVLGTTLATIGILKRQTATLFKELEV